MRLLPMMACFVTALIAAGCAAPPAKQTIALPDKIGFEEARKMFEGRGVQPGEPLPALSLVNLDGSPASIASIQGDRPLVLVTCSLTCNVARRQQPQLDDLRTRIKGDAAAVVVLVYVIDAHPSGDPCPYTGKEWVPKDNERDGVLVRQPADLAQRLALARQYQERFDGGTLVLVDTMDDASWKALGQAPNLGLLVDRHGIVRLRQGWFAAPAMAKALEAEGVAIAPEAGPEPGTAR